MFKSSKERLFYKSGKLNVPKEYMLPGYNVAIIPDFLNKYCDADVNEIWNDILSLPSYSEEDEIELEDGWNPKLLPGSHPALRYRGNPVARNKIWLQTDFEDGMKKYGYTGWQWRVSLAQRRIESIPSISKVTDKINSMMSKRIAFNHAIVTVYEDKNDNIGLHSDKMGNFNPNTGFIVVKLGESRRFQFATLDGKVFFDKRLKAGTAVLVGADANVITKHGVPKDPDCKRKSGSIVWRSIGTTVPWSTVEKKIKSATYV